MFIEQGVNFTGDLKKKILLKKTKSKIELRRDSNKIENDMPIKRELKFNSAENISRYHIEPNQRRCNSPPPRHESRYYLPLPLSMALGVSSLSDSKLYSYHNSQEFLTFLTKSAHDLEIAERTNTIDSALNQIQELKDLVEDNDKMLNFVRNTQEYNPSRDIEDYMVENISKTLQIHRAKVEKMCDRSKEYEKQLILAESDLDTNNNQEMKTDLLAIRKSLTWMSMIIRYHTWGASVIDETLYHSDDEILNHRRKLGRRNGIRLRERPTWTEYTPTPTKQTPPNKQILSPNIKQSSNSKSSLNNKQSSISKHFANIKQSSISKHTSGSKQSSNKKCSDSKTKKKSKEKK